MWAFENSQNYMYSYYGVFVSVNKLQQQSEIRLKRINVCASS